MGKVYFVSGQEAVSANFSDVKRFGTPVDVNHKFVFCDELDDIRRLPESFRDHIDDAAEAFDPREDYVIILGDHVQLLYFSAALVVRHGYYFALRWDKEIRGYYPVRIGN